MLADNVRMLEFDDDLVIVPAPEMTPARIWSVDDEYVKVVELATEMAPE